MKNTLKTLKFEYILKIQYYTWHSVFKLFIFFINMQN